MSNVETAPRVSPANSAQNPHERTQDDIDAVLKDIALHSEFDDIVANEYGEEHRPAAVALEDAPDLKDSLILEEADKTLEKTKDLARLLDTPADRRRGLIAIYGEDTVKDMTDADVEAFISEKTGDMSATATLEQERTHNSAVRPEGFADYDFDALEAQLKEDNDMEPLREEAGRHLGFGWIGDAARYSYAKYHVFKASLQERKEERLNKKTAGMSEEQRTAYLEEVNNRSRRRRKLAGAAIIVLAATGLAWQLKNNIDRGTGGGGNNNDVNLTGGDDGGQGNHEGHTGGVPGVGEIDDQSPESLNLYSNGDPSFYDYINKDFRGDFGPGLNGSPNDGAMGFGFEDWMGRSKHEPNGLGNLISGIKIDGKGDSLADRNAFADFLDSNRAEHQRYDEMVQSSLRDPSQFKVDSVDITSPYDTTYMVDGNGDPIIATQQGVDYGGTAFKITNVKTGEITYWRKDCGGYQQIWLREDLIVQNTPDTSNVAVGNGQPASNNLVGNRPWQNNGGGNPQQPQNPGTGGGNPQQPNNPQPGGEQPGGEQPGGEEPGGETPDENKIYSGGVDTADGIDPSQNGRVGPTLDPLVTGNGTGSPNLTTGPQAGGESTTPLEGALPNVDPQIDVVQPGLDTGWKPDTPGQADQGAADTTGNVIDTQMGQPGAVDSAVDDAVAGMGANGRPLGSGGGSGTGLGSLGNGNGTGLGSGLGSGLGNGTGGLGALGGGGTGINAGLGAPK